MSRSGYSDDDSNDSGFALSRGSVTRAMRGRRGQKLLHALLAALNEMPEKRLIANDLVRDGEVCLLGAGGRKLGIADLDKLDPEDHDTLAERFNAARCLIKEIEFVNDEEGPWSHEETPEERFRRMRAWLVKNIAAEELPAKAVSQ